MKRTQTRILGHNGSSVLVDEHDAAILRIHGTFTRMSSRLRGAYYWTDGHGNEYVTYPYEP